MAAFIFVADNWRAASASPRDRNVLLESDGYYFFLNRYFEGANLDHHEELIDLYGGREIEGYQLHRLETELITALEDVGRKPESWRVLTGWNIKPALENEIWREVERDRMIDLIEQLLWLTEFAKQHRLKLICSGD